MATTNLELKVTLNEEQAFAYGGLLDHMEVYELFEMLEDAVKEKIESEWQKIVDED